MGRRIVGWGLFAAGVVLGLRAYDRRPDDWRQRTWRQLWRSDPHNESTLLAGNALCLVGIILALA